VVNVEDIMEAVVVLMGRVVSEMITGQNIVDRELGIGYAGHKEGVTAYVQLHAVSNSYFG
jgi:hypothetical protein